MVFVIVKQERVDELDTGDWSGDVCSSDRPPGNWNTLGESEREGEEGGGGGVGEGGGGRRGGNGMMEDRGRGGGQEKNVGRRGTEREDRETVDVERRVGREGEEEKEEMKKGVGIQGDQGGTVDKSPSTEKRKRKKKKNLPVSEVAGKGDKGRHGSTLGHNTPTREPQPLTTSSAPEPHSPEPHSPTAQSGAGGHRVRERSE